MKDLILNLAKRGKTVLLCSHLLADVEDVCDKIAILYGGKIQSEGRVKELLQQTEKRQITTGAISDTAIEKIKQVVRDEQADCVVTSPMDKLETFFIKTVAAAQQQAQPTSGAVSTTQIGGFLAPDTPVENILDKLVSPMESLRTAPVSQEPTGPATTESADKRIETSETKPDEQLLRELTEQAKPAQSKGVVRDEKVVPAKQGPKTEPVKPKAPKSEQIEPSILDQLTGRRPPQNEDNEGKE